MTFIPNEADAGAADQAKLFSQHFGILIPAHRANGVLNGCAVSAQGTPDLTVAVAAGLALVDRREVEVAADDVTITAADGTNPRFDLIVVDAAGALAATAGTAAASPVPPSPAADEVALALVYVAANDTDIDTADIADVRVNVRGGVNIDPGSGRDAVNIPYVIPGTDIVSTGTRGVFANRDYYGPLYVPQTITLDRLACRVSTAAASAGDNLRLGIFEADWQWQPGALVLDAGEVAADTTGTKAVTIDQTLEPGRYLWALAVEANCTMGVWRGGSQYIGIWTDVATTVLAVIVSNRTYAAFPATGAAWTGLTTSSTPFEHMIAVRRSA